MFTRKISPLNALLVAVLPASFHGRISLIGDLHDWADPTRAVLGRPVMCVCCFLRYLEKTSTNRGKTSCNQLIYHKSHINLLFLV